MAQNVVGIKQKLLTGISALQERREKMERVLYKVLMRIEDTVSS